MNCYSKKTIDEYALWNHVEIRTHDFRGYENENVYIGWLVPNPKNGRFYKSNYLLLCDGGGSVALERSHIGSITLDNKFTLPKRTKK